LQLAGVGGAAVGGQVGAQLHAALHGGEALGVAAELDLGVGGDRDGRDPAALGAARGAEGTVSRAQVALAENPDDPAALSALAEASLVRARETGDPSWHTRAEQAARAALAADARRFTAMDTLGTLALTRHRFAEALSWSRRSLAVAPGRVDPIAIMADAQIELGRYPQGFAAVQRRLELRPDLPSYSRASYARELQGDRATAIRLMELAVGAGALGSPDRAFAQVQLGLLRLGQGDIAAAERAMRAALAERPDDAPATAGLARVLAARGALGPAAELYSRAIDLLPLPEYPAALADVHRAQGRPEAVREDLALAQAMQDLLAANGSDVDLDVALIRADARTPAAADIALARRAREGRPGVVGDQVLGWVLTRAGRCAEGDRFATRSLRLGTQDALMLFHAGMAASCAGRADAARERLARALELNPAFSVRWAPVARRELARLAS
ncbi:MAG TPA: tetratricopeptide repeat protein, partial [Miltoncostaeaceae bacterium]|nr:tetratricopeptide repeat protein [Miltoncostaeaceae bacterium]